MNLSRIQKLQALLRADRADGALYAPSGALQYFLDDPSYFWQRTTETGFGRTPEEKAPNGHFARLPDRMLFIPADGEPTLIVVHPLAEAMQNCGVRLVATHYVLFSDALRPLLKGARRIAVGESCDAALRALVAAVDNTLETPGAEDYSDRLRMIKDTAEIARLEAAAAMTDAAMGEITRALVPGVTALDIRRLMGQIALREGCALSFDPGVIFVATDQPGAERLFSAPPDRPLAPGTAVGFDFGFVRDGYCSDYGRSFYLGQNDAIRDAYKALHAAQLELFRHIRPGVRLNLAFDTLLRALEPTGFAPYLRRTEFGLMGHQIGIDVHERPWLRDDEDTAVFEPGMVMCIEPKIWWPGKCYLRCEDMVLITETGCRSLTVYNRDHFIL